MAEPEIVTNFKLNGIDIGEQFVTKTYLIDIYPELSSTGPYTIAGLWLWERDIYGNLGANNTASKSSPQQTVHAGATWKQVAMGTRTTAAIKTDNRLWTWGWNAYGQLGINSIISKSSPVQTTTGAVTWKSVSCGYLHTSAVGTDGTLWCWGYNDSGQLGINLGITIKKSTPVQVTGGGTNWKQVSCGNRHTIAVKTDGTLWAWGENGNGKLGINLITNKSTPVQVTGGATNWKQISCGFYGSGAIKTDGTLWLWGSNTGNDNQTTTSSPIQTMMGGNDWRQVSCGQDNSAAIKTNGTLWVWGNNTNGQIGDNTTIRRSSPVQTICEGTNWKQVSVGDHTLAIKTDGTLWAWGKDTYGELGDMTTISRSSPIQIIAGSNTWKFVGGGYATHSAAIKEMGEDF